MSQAQPFHNAHAPMYGIQKERPRHRLVAQLSMNGYDNKEIAAIVGYTECSIHNILRQPWLSAYMAQELQDKGDEMRETIMMEAKAAFAREVDLSQTAKSESVRHQANTYLVDRYLGKPTQPIEEINKKPMDMTDEELKQALPSLLRQDALRVSAPSAKPSFVDEPIEPFPMGENGFST